MTAARKELISLADTPCYHITAQFMSHTILKQLNPSSYLCFNVILEKLMRQQ